MSYAPCCSSWCNVSTLSNQLPKIRIQCLSFSSRKNPHIKVQDNRHNEEPTSILMAMHEPAQTTLELREETCGPIYCEKREASWRRLCPSVDPTTLDLLHATNTCALRYAENVTVGVGPENHFGFLLVLAQWRPPPFAIDDVRAGLPMLRFFCPSRRRLDNVGKNTNHSNQVARRLREMTSVGSLC